ncbi:MAG: DUF4105 domain-containing protein [Pseudomonadota bacterium]
MRGIRLITLLATVPLLAACAGLSEHPHSALSADDEFRSLHKVAGNGAWPAEDAFAQELNAFLSRDDYHCTHPLHYRYFEARYDITRARADCPETVPFRVISGIDGAGIRWLDPDRIHSIHVLFAGEGEAIMSRFGHLSFRLIVCPEQERSREACARNLEEHVVLGFRAQVDDFSISYWNGLFGGYRTHLYANPFMDIYREYAIGEFRELYSLPLALDPEQTRRMVRELAAIHWSYSGDYRFLTNNCSSIAQNYLIQSWDRFSETHSVADVFWRPDYFFGHLRETDLVHSHLLQDLDQAERNGHYFPSTRPAYQRALDLVAQTRTEPHFQSLEDYVTTPPHERRSAAVADTAYIEALTDNPRLRTAQLLLEEIAVVRYEKQLMTEVSRYFAQRDVETVQQAVAAHVTPAEYQAFNACVVEPLRARLQPIAREDGIPPPNTAVQPQESPGFCETTEGRRHLQSALDALNQNSLPDWEGVAMAISLWNGTFRNIAFYSDLGRES